MCKHTFRSQKLWFELTIKCIKNDCDRTWRFKVQTCNCVSNISLKCIKNLMQCNIYFLVYFRIMPANRNWSIGVFMSALTCPCSKRGGVTTPGLWTRREGGYHPLRMCCHGNHILVSVGGGAVVLGCFPLEVPGWANVALEIWTAYRGKICDRPQIMMTYLGQAYRCSEVCPLAMCVYCTHYGKLASYTPTRHTHGRSVHSATAYQAVFVKMYTRCRKNPSCTQVFRLSTFVLKHNLLSHILTV